MRTNRLIITALTLMMGFSVAMAKEIKVITFKVEDMECANCEAKVKKNIRFEKGLKKIETNLEDHTVTLEFDADKTDVKQLIKGFEKIKFEAVPMGEPKAKK